MAAPQLQFADMGKTDVLLIASELTNNRPLAVRHRPCPQLSQTEVDKLENQGVSKEHHTDDCSIMKARYSLDTDCCIWPVEQGRVTALEIRRKIAVLFSSTKNPSSQHVFVSLVNCCTVDLPCSECNSWQF